MRKVEVLCDMCSKPRREVNHWFVVEVCKGGESLRINKFDPKQDTVSGRWCLDICGSQCLYQLISRWMDGSLCAPGEACETFDKCHGKVPVDM